MLFFFIVLTDLFDFHCVKLFNKRKKEKKKIDIVFFYPFTSMNVSYVYTCDVHFVNLLHFASYVLFHVHFVNL